MRPRTSILRGMAQSVALPALVALAAAPTGCAATQAMHSGPGVPALEGRR